MSTIPNLFTGTSINPECAWVLAGTHATKMYDGVGYVVVDTSPRVCPDEYETFYRDALIYHEVEDGGLHTPWSYELCGPFIKGNHEQQPRPILIPHGRFLYRVLTGTEISYDTIKQFLAGRNSHGIVFWEDIWDYTCRKAKVTQEEFGMKRNLKGDQE